jgi:hypothetical protein
MRYSVLALSETLTKKSTRLIPQCQGKSGSPAAADPAQSVLVAVATHTASPVPGVDYKQGVHSSRFSELIDIAIEYLTNGLMAS